MNSFSTLVIAAMISVPVIAAETAPAAVPQPAVAETVSAGVPGKISANVLNARLDASLKSPAAKKLRKDDAVVITGVKGNWYEISAPQGTVLYASGVFLRDGKALEKTSLRIKAAGQAPVAAVLAKGDSVKVLGDAGYGWVKVEAPATLKLYVAKFYVDADAKQIAQLNAAKAKAEKTKPVVTAGKPAPVKAEDVKAPEAQPAKDAAKPEVKVEAAVAPAPAPVPVKAAPKKPAIPQQDPVKVREMQDQALKELGVDPAKSEETKTLSGKLIRVPESTNAASSFALLVHGGEDFVFVCTVPEAVSMWVDQFVTIRGETYLPSGWKHAVLRADDIKAER